jgi:hypothetical protein
LALRELHASHLGEKTEAICEILACRCGRDSWMLVVAGAIRASMLPQLGE